MKNKQSMEQSDASLTKVLCQALLTKLVDSFLKVGIIIYLRVAAVRKGKN